MSDWKKILNDTRAVLAEAGFKVYEKCNCHGTYTEKYTNAEKSYKIYIKPKRNLFTLYKGSICKKQKFLYQLHQTLIEDGIILDIQP